MIHTVIKNTIALTVVRLWLLKRAIFVSTILPINKAMFVLIHGLMAVAMVMIFHHGTMSDNPSFPR